MSTLTVLLMILSLLVMVGLGNFYFAWQVMRSKTARGKTAHKIALMKAYERGRRDGWNAYADFAAQVQANSMK